MSFSDKLLAWYDQHGRKDLPWQKNINPYRVWVSEIMLQQTQVTTVTPYFERFINQFPDVISLANANIDNVLHLWTGLGYYARARNLHKTAAIVRDEFDGSFPDNFEQMQNFPGIGRSTAGAILSIAFQKPQTILDGNVKRVLARLHTVEGWTGEPRVANQLWEIAEGYTPNERVADYTQAIMDLGATLCTRSAPRCQECPLQADCLAFAADAPTDFPHKKPKKEKPVKSVIQLLIVDEGKVLLEKRPPTGIWGGLYCFVECTDPSQIDSTCKSLLGLEVELRAQWKPFRHTFSHYHLDIQPMLIDITHQSTKIMDSDQYLWYNLGQVNHCGLSAPAKRLLEQLETEVIS